MARNTNQSAQAAKELKKQLTTRFPGIKFSVTSDTYSGGSSVNVGWAFGPSNSQVEELSSARQYGYFDGMTDMYEVTGAGIEVSEGGEFKEVASAKFVFENRNIKYVKDSYTIREDVRNLYKQIGELRGWEEYEHGDYTPGGNWQGPDQTASTIYYRTVSEISFLSDNVELLEIKWTGYTYNGKNWQEPYTIIYKDLNTGKIYDGKIDAEPGAPVDGKSKIEIKPQPAAKKEVFLINYSEKSFVVYGDGTYPIKEQLLSMHGTYNSHLKHPQTGEKLKGYVFSLKRKDKVIDKLKDILYSLPKAWPGGLMPGTFFMKKTDTFFIGEYYTTNFTFHAISTTEVEVREAIVKGWKKHCRQTGADINYFKVEDISVAPIKINKCLRDFNNL
jgi:hypothetical protein